MITFARLHANLELPSTNPLPNELFSRLACVALLDGYADRNPQASRFGQVLGMYVALNDTLEDVATAAIVVDLNPEALGLNCVPPLCALKAEAGGRANRLLRLPVELIRITHYGPVYGIGKECAIVRPSKPVR
jgi:hypothetical protein